MRISDYPVLKVGDRIHLAWDLDRTGEVIGHGWDRSRLYYIVMMDKFYVDAHYYSPSSVIKI